MIEIALWADGTVARREDIAGMTYMSDDYTRYTINDEATPDEPDIDSKIAAQIVADNFPAHGAQFVWGWEPRDAQDRNLLLYQISVDGQHWTDADYYAYEKTRLMDGHRRTIAVCSIKEAGGMNAVHAEVRLLRRRVTDLEQRLQ